MGPSPGFRYGYKGRNEEIIVSIEVLLPQILQRMLRSDRCMPFHKTVFIASRGFDPCKGSEESAGWGKPQD